MKPNIVFLLLDSFRSDKCYGESKTSKTPNLDMLIKNSTYFSKYFIWWDSKLLGDDFDRISADIHQSFDGL